MKEIKFRCWHKSTKDMIYPDRLRELTMNMMSEDDEDVLMQYTGLPNENDEWYHYDILETIYSKERYLIDWHFNRWILINLKSKRKEEFRQIDLIFFKKIGNKFENPELLEERI